MEKTRINPETIIYNIETIIDIIVFLRIILAAIYTNKKRKKDNDGKGQNYVENTNGANEEKGLIIKEIQQNVKKYNNGKQLLTAFISVPALIICPIPIGFCLYGIITNNPDTRSPIFLIIFLITLLIYIFLLKNSKKTLDKYNNNLFYGMIKLYTAVFIGFIIIAIGWIGSLIIYHELKLSGRLSALISISFKIISMILGIYFTSKYFGFNSKDSVQKKGDNKYIDNGITDNEVTYDEPIDNNKKVEEETGFHQGSLLKK